MMYTSIEEVANLIKILAELTSPTYPADVQKMAHEKLLKILAEL